MLSRASGIVPGLAMGGGWETSEPWAGTIPSQGLTLPSRARNRHQVERRFDGN
jgi:hypothetical protein